MNTTIMKPAVVALLTALSLLTGCTSVAPTSPLAPLYDVGLASGVPLFGEPVSSQIIAIPDAREVIALTPAMGEYIDSRIRGGSAPVDRARRLVKILVREDFFPEDYYTNNTLTAAELFEARTGNCLSYTNLFVAMARHIGLDARFQIARIPAAFSSDEGYLVRSRHINVLIRDSKIPRSEWLTVDFNKVATSNLYPHRIVADEFALSSFYNNLAVDQLYLKNYRASIALIHAAIKVDPYNGDSWVNLAAVYSRNHKLEAAIESLKKAVELEAGNESALAGLVRLLQARGDLQGAAFYASEMNSRRQKNPYFHFALAQAAYEQGDYKQSEKHANAAIDLRSRSGLFYYTRALSQYQQGKLESASASLLLAQEREKSLPDSKQQYALALAEQINKERGVIFTPDS